MILITWHINSTKVNSSSSIIASIFYIHWYHFKRRATMFIVDFDTVCCSPQMPPHLVVGDHVYTHWLYISDTPEKNICFHASPFPPFHTPFLSPRYTALQTFMVDLFMRWGSILALGLSLRWGSYCLFLLTAFVVFINITFWHSDIRTPRGSRKK